MAENLFTDADNILSQDLALPRIEDLIPSPGDIARKIFGSDKTLDAVGARLGSDLKSKLGGMAPTLPSLPSLPMP